MNKIAPKNKFRVLIALVAFTVLAGSSLVLSTSTSAQGKKKTKIDTPEISCGLRAETFIDINVCAPSGTNATGLPAGFSIQWMTKADYEANGNMWFASDDPRLCKASFSGNANLSRYNLAAGQCVTVRIGDLLLDNGASTNCPGILLCETTYVFRAFGHANNTLNRSDFTANLECTTLPCGGGDEDGCTFTQGYWKTHGPVGCLTGNNSTEWPQDVIDNGMMLGNHTYTADQLCNILQTPTGGNGLIALAHQLIAAKLNVANSAGSCETVDAAIAAADLAIGNLMVGTDFLKPGNVSSLVTTLNNYNNGVGGDGCPSHCDSEVPE